jgi:hypothetical protein
MLLLIRDVIVVAVIFNVIAPSFNAVVICIFVFDVIVF